ncbi:MAG TPA: YkgJ family cysteine cluster protein [Bdellovibrionota bacterium]|jgi:hypothetical protein
MEAPAPHPCQTCGACCAYYRVSFYWREAETSENPGAVPVELTEDYSSFRRSMRGTNRKHHSRCVALEGKVGEQVACSIYTLRPSPCREFLPSFEDGNHQPRCDEARARYGLRPLTRKDWLSAFAQALPAAKLDGNEKDQSPV